MISINGETAPRSYLQSVVPWMLQSPVYPTIGLLISSAVQAGIVGFNAKTIQEVATLKARVFFLMQKYIESRSPTEWAEELMGCTLNLLVFEVGPVHYPRRHIWPETQANGEPGIYSGSGERRKH